MAAVLFLQACGGEATQQAGEDGIASAAPQPAGGRPVQQPISPSAPATPTPRASHSPPAPYYFSHARFVQAWDDQGRPLGLKVESVLAGGRVALAGIQAGDVIHAIDGVAMDAPATFGRAVRMAEDMFRERRPQHFVVTREGRKLGLMPLGAVKSGPAASEQP